MKRDFPDVRLVPLLEVHGLSWEQFSKRGQLPVGLEWILSKRSAIITELHVVGTFEPAFYLVDGRKIIPDFLVTFTDGKKTLLEIKASWALRVSSDHKISRRLRDAENLAKSKGWDFVIWTEKDRLKNVVCD